MFQIKFCDKIINFIQLDNSYSETLSGFRINKTVKLLEVTET
jgi:hypothetical protein